MEWLSTSLPKISPWKLITCLEMISMQFKSLFNHKISNFSIGDKKAFGRKYFQLTNQVNCVAKRGPTDI